VLRAAAQEYTHENHSSIARYWQRKQGALCVHEFLGVTGCA
jgi:hypothetical protein